MEKENLINRHKDGSLTDETLQHLIDNAFKFVVGYNVTKLPDADGNLTLNFDDTDDTEKIKEHVKQVTGRSYDAYVKRLMKNEGFEDEVKRVLLQWVDELQGYETQVRKGNAISYPDKYTTSTDNFINDLPLQDLSNINFKVARNTDKYITGMLNIDGEELTDMLPNLTNEHLMYFEGICNIYLNDSVSNVFSPEMVYRYATGRKDARLTPNKRERIIQMLEEMARMRVSLDLDEYLSEYGNDNVKKTIKEGKSKVNYGIRSYLLPIESVSELIQGQEQETVYRLIKAPALLEYNNHLKNRRIGFIDGYLLDTLSTSVEDSLLKRYLAKRLIALETPRNGITNPKILFTSIYEKIDVDNPTAKKRHTIKGKIEQVLDYWTGKGRIKGYEFTRKGKQFDGVEIEYIPRTKALK